MQFLKNVCCELNANVLYAWNTWMTYQNAKRVQYKTDNTAQNSIMQYA